MSRFTIGIAKLGVELHSSCFVDVARALAASLRALGHEVVDFGPSQGRLIMFGVNNSVPSGDDRAIPKNAIVFNTEQVGSASGVDRQMTNFETWKRHVLWDYSQSNIYALRAAGAKRVVHCPVGYHQSMTTIEPSPVEDIDVLFYGSVNPRRKEILDALTTAGLNVHHLFGVYGAERDAVIARSKVVLNLHFYEQPVFEIFRVSHLLANKKCVVSEDGGCDEQLEGFARRATTMRSREELVDICQKLVANDEWRGRVAEGGYYEFRRTSFVDNVRRALEATEIYDREPQ